MSKTKNLPESTDSERVQQPPREFRPYSAPVLKKFGAISDLTRTGVGPLAEPIGGASEFA